MGIKVKVNERTKTDAPEKPRDEALWILPPSQPDKPERPKMEPITLPCGPRPMEPECCVPPLIPKEPKNPSPVVNESENELYEKILKALEKDEKRHYTMDLPIEGTEWIEDGEFFYTTIKASKHNVIFPIVKDVFILNENGNYESTFFSYEVLSNGDIRIISSEPHNYKVYIESEE